MVTKTFPIFRGLQRAIIGSAGVGRQASAFSSPARHHRGIDEDRGEINHDPRIPTSGDTNGASYEKSSTWPVNSEAARQMRREFVQEGFRRLYSSAGLHMGENANLTLFPHNNGVTGSFIGGLIGAIRATIRAIVSLGNSFVTLNDAIAAEFSEANILEGNHVTRGDASTGDWMYYPQ